MKKKWLLTVAAIAIIIILLIPRENPEDYISRLPQQTGVDWGHINVLQVMHMPKYTIVLVKFQTVTADFKPTSSGFFIKEYSRANPNDQNGFPEWTGKIYLVKKGLYTWEAIQ